MFLQNILSTLCVQNQVDGSGGIFVSLYVSEIDSGCVQYQNLRIRDIVDQNTIDDKCKKDFCIFKEKCKNFNSTRKRYCTTNALMRHSLPQPLRLGNDAAPPKRQCATDHRSCCDHDHARCVPAHLPLLGSCHRTQQDLKWLRVRRQGPRCIPLWRLQPL